jgi:hypothetical protein
MHRRRRQFPLATAAAATTRVPNPHDRWQYAAKATAFTVP